MRIGGHRVGAHWRGSGTALRRAGHEVALSYAVGPQSLRERGEARAPGTGRHHRRGGGLRRGDIPCHPLARPRDLSADRLRGKIAVDAVNP